MECLSHVPHYTGLPLEEQKIICVKTTVTIQGVTVSFQKAAHAVWSVDSSRCYDNWWLVVGLIVRPKLESDWSLILPDNNRAITGQYGWDHHQTLGRIYHHIHHLWHGYFHSYRLTLHKYWWLHAWTTGREWPCVDVLILVDLGLVIISCDSMDVTLTYDDKCPKTNWMRLKLIFGHKRKPHKNFQHNWSINGSFGWIIESTFYNAWYFVSLSK